MASKSSYCAEKDIPDLTGKVILITGGTAGLGKETITTLAKHNSQHIFFTGRNVQAAENIVGENSLVARVTFIECDQSSLASVQAAAKQFLNLADRLDIFIPNAGILGSGSNLSEDGYGIPFAVNYLSHALFIKLLLPTLEHTAMIYNGARIILLASYAFRGLRHHVA